MRNRFSAICLALVLGISLASAPAYAKPKPTLAEIEAAKQAEVQPGETTESTKADNVVDAEFTEVKKDSE